MTTAPQTPAKKPGAIRIGVVTPKAQMGGTGPGANSVPEAVRALIVQYLSGPVLEVTPIAAMLRSKSRRSYSRRNATSCCIQP